MPILQSTVVTIMPQRGLILVPGMSKDGVYLGPVAIEHVFLNSVYDVFTSVHKKMVCFSTSLERERNLVKEILLLPIPVMRRSSQSNYFT